MFLPGGLGEPPDLEKRTNKETPAREEEQSGNSGSGTPKRQGLKDLQRLKEESLSKPQKTQWRTDLRTECSKRKNCFIFSPALSEFLDSIPFVYSSASSPEIRSFGPEKSPNSNATEKDETQHTYFSLSMAATIEASAKNLKYLFFHSESLRKLIC